MTVGFTLNASLAVNLPSACHAPANISQCIDLLHLAPNSFEAKVFEGFDKATPTNTSSSAPLAPAGKGSSPPSTSATEKNGGVSVAVWEKRLGNYDISNCAYYRSLLTLAYKVATCIIYDQYLKVHDLLKLYNDINVPLNAYCLKFLQPGKE
ncbi:hypothetical protein K1719_044570 [Acacia pycnantha]|nr:hypothetical protein K1719_044570 [Acacia pycnantha]